MKELYTNQSFSNRPIRTMQTGIEETAKPPARASLAGHASSRVGGTRSLDPASAATGLET